MRFPVSVSSRAARCAALRRAQRASAVQATLGASLCLLLTACGGDKPSIGATASLVVRDSVVAGDSVPVRVVESTEAEADERAAPFTVDFEPELVIGTDEGEPAYELHRVYDAIRWPDGRMVIANSGSGELRIFNASGTFLGSVGRTGQGPGEFDVPSIFLHAWGDSLLATDQLRVHVYGPSLEYVQTRAFDLAAGPSNVFLNGVFSDGAWLASAPEGGGVLNGAVGTVITMAFQVLRYTPDGRLPRELFQFAGRPRYRTSTQFPYIPLTSESIFGTMGDSTVVLREGQPELEWYDTHGRVVQVARWSRRRVPSREVYPVFKDSTMAVLRRNSAQAAGFQMAANEELFKADLPIPEFAPLYTTLKVDDERRIWLERFRLPGDTGPRRWDVINASGEWLGTVDVPPRFTLFRAGRDYVLGRTLDSLGVERVQRHRLRPVAGR